MGCIEFGVEASIAQNQMQNRLDMKWKLIEGMT